MPINILQICREVLERTYREKLGFSFGSSLDDVIKGRGPVWRTVSGEDLTSELGSNVDDAAGLLLDPEIGVLCYILPFASETNLRSQLMRCLALRSQLSIESNYTGSLTDKSDSRGAWRIIVHWLVDNRLRQKWIDQITDVRSEIAFSEELSLDAIFFNDVRTKEELERYGFPRLLLTTREVFKKDDFKEMTQWLSANKLVVEALAGFADQFNIPEQNGFANEVVEAMEELNQPSPVSADENHPTKKPREVRNIHIHNFRNLRDIQFDFGVQPVSASIIHGPNGTGKSSLCEALSIALFKSSYRYESFSNGDREKDITVRDRASEYTNKYLTPLGEQIDRPQIALDGAILAQPELVGIQSVADSELLMGGTILTQDASSEFARMPSAELGAQVLRGYSDLADRIEEFTESRLRQVDSERQVFMRSLGLTLAIKKIDTAYERIARREIDHSLPPLPQSLIQWLEIVGKVIPDVASGLPQRWRAWGAEPSRAAFAGEIATLNSNNQKLIRVVEVWLQRFNELASGSSELVKNAEAKIGPFRSDLGNSVDRITVWGEWLEEHSRESKITDSPETEALVKGLHNLQAELRELSERGRMVGIHYEHLSSVEAFIRETWSKQNADSCPTCGTNHSEHGGIVRVVEVLRAKTGNDRELFQQQYADLQTRIELEQKKLAEFGSGECPLSLEEQSKLGQAFQWLIPNTVELAEWIKVKSQRDTLLASIAMIRQMPSAPATINIEGEAKLFADRLFLQFREAERTFDAPANWKPVKDKLTETLSEIVSEHLPNTLAKLWCELALNLTSAPWLLPERPRVDVATRRGEKKLTVRVNDRLARYILNQSELHVLGLAWFFTRYLTRGRFFHASMVMDDAAHELDQTSFRDLCRLWETIMRLHRVYKKPLKLIIMLNQENRAIDAARATSGVLSILGWTRDQEEPISSINVIGDGFYAPQPASLFEKTEK